MGNSTFSVIGSDVTITGDISAATELHIDGQVDGDIDCASLVQGEHSCIKGAIKAENARMAGEVIGTISARELVILQSAKIKGDVNYDALTIEQGAEVEGRFAQRAATDGLADNMAEDMTGQNGTASASNGSSNGGTAPLELQ